MNPVATSDAAFRGGACPTPEYTIAYTGNYTTSADANQRVACQETDWKKYRYRSRGQWRFATSADLSPTTVDTVRISHVIHDREQDRTPDPVNACSGLTVPSALNSGGA